MPTYDVKCSACNYEAAMILKMSELALWDDQAQCPQCGQSTPGFRRIIKMAPGNSGGEKAAARSKVSERESRQRDFVSSGKKDDMRHNQAKNRNHDQIGEAREIVKSGKFEGF